jgi:hypothetical protein
MKKEVNDEILVLVRQEESESREHRCVVSARARPAVEANVGRSHL